MNHIELFAGCGGLTLGLETAGFELLLANELSPMASETFSYNILDVDLEKGLNTEKVLWVSSKFKRQQITQRLRENPLLASGLAPEHFSDLTADNLSSDDLKRSLLVGSIVDLNKLIEKKASRLLSLIKESTNNGEIDLVSGGPPCQSFSLAGLRDVSNHRNQLPWEFVKFVKHTRPKIALLENVSGILRAFKIDGRPFYAWFEVAKAFASVSYVPLCLHVNAKYVGAAQNRPRFILIAIRDDVFSNIINNSEDKILLDAFEPSKRLFEEIKTSREPEYGTLPFFDASKNHPLFSIDIFSPLVSHDQSRFVTVKDAIDDLRDSNLEHSQYVTSINGAFDNPYDHSPNKNYNHEKRTNSPKVRARFRLYQVLTKLKKEESSEITKYLKSSGASGISSPVLTSLRSHWLLNLEGEKTFFDDELLLLALLSALFTKKQTQRALIANAPAPAALSIPDDACHYHEAEDTQRTLTVREMARIQSFPDWYKIKSKVTTGGQMRKFEVPQYTQIGNAVPPLLALALGKVCSKLLDISEKK